MQKPKAYDWKDSNMALFGSDVEKNIKKASAETEEAWNGCGQEVGIQIWRINNFKVEHWRKEDYGQFFNGDSYIILHTYKNPDGDSLEYDLHFWIGKYSTQDEYGTAAYKTVELDIYLNDKPVQHREVMDHESKLFKSLFTEITILDGGAKSGFRHVEKVVTEPQLFHVHGDIKRVTIKQVPLNLRNLDHSDVYVLKTGEMIYQWNGRTCNKDEKFKGMQYTQKLKTGKIKSETLDDDFVEDDHPFWSFFSDDNPVEAPERRSKPHIKKLIRVCDASGETRFEEVAQGVVLPWMFDGDDVFIFDKAETCFVWVGKGATANERREGFKYSHNYLMTTGDPCKHVMQIDEGCEPNDFFD